MGNIIHQFKAHEIDKLSAWNKKQSTSIQLRLVRTAHDASNEFLEFYQMFVEHVPCLNLELSYQDEDAPPYLLIKENIKYSARAMDNELEPFLDVLSTQNDKANRFGKAQMDQLQHVASPVLLNLFIAPQCPYCPIAFKQTVDMAILNPHIRLRIIDGLLFDDIARTNKVESAPTLIFDNQIRWTGTINFNEVINILSSHDPSQMSTGSIEAIIKEGNAGLITSLMLNYGKILPNLLELVVHENWSTRLGAMVVMEDLIEENIELGVQGIQKLWQKFSSYSPAAQGDLIYLAGQTKLPEFEETFKLLLESDCSPEVKSAISDALEAF